MYYKVLLTVGVHLQCTDMPNGFLNEALKLGGRFMYLKYKLQGKFQILTRSTFRANKSIS